MHHWSKNRDRLLPPANEVCEGYVFTGVCLSTGGILVSVKGVSDWGSLSRGSLPGGCLSRRPLSGGSLSREVSTQGSLSRGFCPGVSEWWVSVQEVSVQGGLCLGVSFCGVSVRGSLSR